MKNRTISVKVKVFLGYITLVVLASLIIRVIYTEVLQYSREKVDFNPSITKFKHVNAILTNLYLAEGLERDYVQTGQISQDYPELMKTISIQIEALVLMINDPTQQVHTYSIKKLLQMKQRNLNELSTLINTDSNRLLKKKKAAKVNNRITQINTADLTAGDKAGKMTNARYDGDAIQVRLKQKEQEILTSDRTITFQLRQMLSYLEKEELINSFQKVKKQQIRVQKATGLIILLGSLALIATIIFLINIIRDITRSQRYRKQLELSTAYSESLLKSKEQFMLSLTHDLKSPLNSIIGFTSFMEKDLNTSSQHRQYLHHIGNASNHILKLVNDLLDLARLETGKLAIDRIPFDFNKLINQIVEAFNPQALAKNINLQLDFEQSLSDAYTGDPARLTQIFGNLISNALKFTESGNVIIQVKLLTQLGNTDQVQVDVIDTGIGILEEDIHRVFEEFNRAGNTKIQYEGTGLGLTITKKLVDLLHGTITLKSQPGVGSHFTVFLPIERGEHSSDISPQLVEDTSLENSCDIAGMSIWLVDDDQLLLDMSSIILKSAGAVVHSFSDPQKAINSFNKGCADLLITDIQMPGMSGIEVLKQIQEKNEGLIASIAISGKNPIQIDYDGFSAFIQKPFQAHTLMDVICRQHDRIIRNDKPEGSSNDGKKEYKLDHLLAFAERDPESLNQILVSFIDTGNQNLKLLIKYIEEEDTNSIEELSHKMLPIFRQLEAIDVVELLVSLERNDIHSLDKEHYYSNGRQAIKKIDILLQTIKKEQNIDVG